MRPIRFRVWNKTNREMTFGGAFSTLEIDGKNQEWFGMKTPHPDDCEVMQYTGLKDKNGKEIYEGDIVTYGFKTKDFNDLVLHTGKVFFDEFMFLVDGDKINEEWHSINRVHYVEVIGNTCENPELMKDVEG